MKRADTGGSSSDDNKEEKAKASNVRVVIRVRPINPAEDGSDVCVTIPEPDDDSCSDEEVNNQDDGNKHSRVIGIETNGAEGTKTFTFDQVLPSETTQKNIFRSSVLPLIESSLTDGYNATVLAYGQTGSGKTFTIFGKYDDNEDASIDDSDSEEKKEEEEDNGGLQGVIPRSLQEMFRRLDNAKRNGGRMDGDTKQATSEEEEGGGDTFDYDVQLQSIEIYGEDLRDLLRPSSSAQQQPQQQQRRGSHRSQQRRGSPPRGKSSPPRRSSNASQALKIRDFGGGNEPEVVGATTTTVTSYREAMSVLTTGLERRVVGSTDMNAGSSRSHVIMTVAVTQRRRKAPSGGGNKKDKGTVEVRRSKLHFVDLAGSESLKRTNAQGTRMKEGIDINKGLTVLGRVISALGQKQSSNKKGSSSVIPYRDSKLTRLLRGSLGGSHKTLMIACVSPSALNQEESLRCLRYASRAKLIQNKAEANVTVDGPGGNSKEAQRLRSKLKNVNNEMSLVKEHLQLMALEMLKSRNRDDMSVSTEALEKLAKGVLPSKDDMSLSVSTPALPVKSNIPPAKDSCAVSCGGGEEKTCATTAETLTPPPSESDDSDEQYDAPIRAIVLPMGEGDDRDANDGGEKSFADDVSSLAASDYQQIAALREELEAARAERDAYRRRLSKAAPSSTADDDCSGLITVDSGRNNDVLFVDFPSARGQTELPKLDLRSSDDSWSHDSVALDSLDDSLSASSLSPGRRRKQFGWRIRGVLSRIDEQRAAERENMSQTSEVPLPGSPSTLCTRGSQEPRRPRLLSRLFQDADSDRSTDTTVTKNDEERTIGEDGIVGPPARPRLLSRLWHDDRSVDATVIAKNDEESDDEEAVVEPPAPNRVAEWCSEWHDLLHNNDQSVPHTNDQSVSRDARVYV